MIKRKRVAPLRFREESSGAMLSGPYTVADETGDFAKVVSGAIANFNSTPEVVRAMKTVPLFEARPSERYDGVGGFSKRFTSKGSVVALHMGQLHWAGRELFENGFDVPITVLSWRKNNPKFLPVDRPRVYRANMDLKKGNPSTYCLNHSCAPNCSIVTEFVTFCDDEARELTIPLFFVVTVADVEADDEFTFDYKLTSKPANGARCKCGCLSDKYF